MELLRCIMFEVLHMKVYLIAGKLDLNDYLLYTPLFCVVIGMRYINILVQCGR